MTYFALDFETGNASPLSACALGVSIFEDGKLAGERVSLLKPPSCAGRFVVTTIVSILFVTTIALPSGVITSLPIFGIILYVSL